MGYTPRIGIPPAVPPAPIDPRTGLPGTPVARPTGPPPTVVPQYTNAQGRQDIANAMTPGLGIGYGNPMGTGNALGVGSAPPTQSLSAPSVIQPGRDYGSIGDILSYVMGRRGQPPLPPTINPNVSGMPPKGPQPESPLKDFTSNFTIPKPPRGMTRT